MALQMSIAVRNARLNAIETQVGAAPILKIRTLAPPANCAAADVGAELASMTLPSNWMADAAAGAKTLLGTWQDASATATGTAAHFRIYASDGVTCHLQGTVTATGGGGDLQLNTVSIVALGTVTITGFTLTDANP